MKLSPCIVFLTSLLMFVLLSCSGSNRRELLLHKWKLTEYHPLPEFEISDSIRMSIVSSGSIEFKDDYSFVQSIQGDSQAGTYSISKDGKLITFTIEGSGDKWTDTIADLTETLFILNEEVGSRKVYKR